MKYDTIMLETVDGITTLTLNRPERLNAANDQMIGEFIDAISYVDNDDKSRVLVITGAGRAFCSGVDVKDRFAVKIAESKEGKVSQERLGGRRMSGIACMMLPKLRQPVIASVNGTAVGFGCALAVACDIRIASEEARFGMAFIKMGFVPDFGSTYYLPRLIGIAKACELTFTGRIVDAREAIEMGLVNQVVRAVDLKESTMELARVITNGPPLAMQVAKRGLYQGMNNDLETQVQFETFAIPSLRMTEDHKEAVKAFMEKREPKFKGR
ncbi:enoyl-CoA hydratase/isomerase family protein [Chloroflexota bacterium]